MTGRPSKFKEEFIKQAEKLSLLGATDEEVADFFDVDVRTVYRWKNEKESFCQALKVGKEHADARVERSLYQKATGFYYTEEQAFKVKKSRDEEEVEVAEVERFQVSDTTAAIFWLKNRKPAEWRDKVDHDLSGGVTVNIGGSDKGVL